MDIMVSEFYYYEVGEIELAHKVEERAYLSEFSEEHYPLLF